MLAGQQFDDSVNLLIEINGSGFQTALGKLVFAQGSISINVTPTASAWSHYRNCGRGLGVNVGIQIANKEGRSLAQLVRNTAQGRRRNV